MPHRGGATATRSNHLADLRRRLAVLEQAAGNEPWSRVTVVPLPVLPGTSNEEAE
jgi:hypothetical protein